MANGWDRKKLTPNERVFVADYLVSGSYMHAASVACKTKNPDVQGAKIASRPRVQKAIEAAFSARLARVEVKADEVLRELLRIGMFDPADLFNADGTLKPIHEMPIEARRAIASIEVDELFDGSGKDKSRIGVTRKVKFWPKVQSLELLGKNLKLFVERHAIENPDGSALVDAAALKSMAKIIAASGGAE